MWKGQPSGKQKHSYGKSPFLIGKSTVNGPFSTATVEVKLPEGNGKDPFKTMVLSGICTHLGSFGGCLILGEGRYEEVILCY